MDKELTYDCYLRLHRATESMLLAYAKPNSQQFHCERTIEAMKEAANYLGYRLEKI